MREFTKWLVEMDQQQPNNAPPVNGGVTPAIPPEVASELSSIAQKLNALLEKLGIGADDNGENSEPPSQGQDPKGLGDQGAGDKDLTNKTPGPPPNFQ